MSWQLQMTSLCCSLSWEAALGSSRSKYPSSGQTQIHPETEIIPEQPLKQATGWAVLLPMDGILHMSMATAMARSYPTVFSFLPQPSRAAQVPRRAAAVGASTVLCSTPP